MFINETYNEITSLRVLLYVEAISLHSVMTMSGGSVAAPHHVQLGVAALVLLLSHLVSGETFETLEFVNQFVIMLFVVIQGNS